MTERDVMSKFGWHISNTGYNFLTESGTLTDINTIIGKAIDADIRDFGEAVLGSVQKQNKVEKIILQIQKVRNVASPKSNEDSQLAPRMLKLVLTDGHTICQAIEVSNIQFLSRAYTPPGAKLLVNSAKIASGCMLLEPNCCELLGGRVPALFEKWEIIKNISQSLRAVGSDGPPPWVNFGGKIITPTSTEPFKSLAGKITKEATNEFDLHRQDAISNAATGAVKKVFGGGVKQHLPFSNPVKNSDYQERHKARNTRGSKGKGGDVNEKIDKPQKPQERVSLFEFLEDKLTANQIDDKQLANKCSEIENTNYSVNQMKSFKNLLWEDSSKLIGSGKPYNVRSAKSSSMINHSNTKTHAPTNFVASTDVQSQQNNQNSQTAINELSTGLTRRLFDASFATRSLKQHLNLHSNNKPNDRCNNSNTIPSGHIWNIGDACMAKYWEDYKYYNAVVINLTQNTCVVSFNGYGNVEEVLKMDCIPLDVGDPVSSNMTNLYRKDTKGPREYHSNRHPYINKSVNGGNYYHKS